MNPDSFASITSAQLLAFCLLRENVDTWMPRDIPRFIFSLPVQAGTIIGSMFRNWIPVKLYHKPNPAPPQVYEYWMPLI